MKIEEVAKIEDVNEDAIILLKEGMFWRAYERSAQRFYHLIEKYQLIRKEFKALGRSMVYLGFPEMRLKQVVARAKIKGWIIEESFAGQIRITGFPAVVGFDEWKPVVPVIRKSVQPQPADNLYPVANDEQPLRLFDRKSPGYSLPVYKDAYDLMLMLYHFTKHIDRAYRFTLGERLKNENTELLVSIYQAQLNYSRSDNINKAKNHAEVVRLLLRMTNDLHLIELKRFIQMNEKIEDILRQLGGWSKAQHQCRSPADHGLQESAEISSMAP